VTPAANRVVAALALATLAWGGAPSLGCGGAPPAPPDGRWLPGALEFAPRRETLGAFEVQLEGTGWEDAQLRVVQRDRPDRVVLATVPGVAFLEGGRGRATARGEGAAALEDEVQERCADLSVDAVEVELYVLRVSGRFRCRLIDRAFELYVVPEGEAELRFHLRLADPSFNRIALVLARGPDERLFGLGGRDRLALPARRIPVRVTPRDEGRPQATGWRARFRADDGAPGSPVAVPHLLSSRRGAIRVEGAEHSVFDLRRDDRVRVEVFARELTFRLQAGSPLAQVRRAAAGRVVPPPAWSWSGPIVIVEGGSAAVRAALDRLEGAGVRPAALEIRDWHAEGSLAPDPERYPDARALVAALRARGVPVLLPADARVPAADLEHEDENEGETGADDSLPWVRDAAGAPLERNGRRWIDLSTLEGRSAWAQRLRAGLWPGVAGLELVGGASLPFAARAAGAPDADFHDRQPDVLAAAARDAFEGTGVVPLLLCETGSGETPRHGVVFLAGDAGRRATWARLLGAGLSGYAFAAVDVDGSGIGEARDRALARAAFAPLFRVAARDFEDAASLAALAGAARTHAAWAGYRGELARQARESGTPVLRPVWLHRPDAFDLGAEAFLVGDQLLVLPRFDDGPDAIELPAGRWIDVYTGEAHGELGARTRLVPDAPPGRVPLLHADGSIVGLRLRRTLASGP
jgi:alpha-glucosidase